MAKIFTPWAPVEEDEEELAPALVTPQLHAAGQPLNFEAPEMAAPLGAEVEAEAEEDDDMEEMPAAGPSPMMAQAMQVIADQSALIQSLLAQVKHG